MTQEQLAVKNIIVQYCSWKKYDDNAEYLDIDVVNGGTGTYITNGKAIDVTWSRMIRGASQSTGTAMERRLN